MTYYQDTSGRLHSIDDDRFSSLVPSGAVEITSEEYAALINRPLTADEMREQILAFIDGLERRYMIPRATREALLAYAVAIAASSGVSEAQLYAGNIAYRKVKDFDAQIAALRAQL